MNTTPAFLLLLLLAFLTPLHGEDHSPGSADVVVYGATPAGIAAALAAAEGDRDVLLIEPTGRIGGMTTHGLLHLKDLTNLQTLRLQYTKVTDAGLVHIKGMTKLKELVLAVTKVTDAGLVHIKGMTKLKTLILGFTKVTDAGLLHLKDLTKLQRLELENTKVTQTGIADLKKDLPDCKISH